MLRICFVPRFPLSLLSVYFAAPDVYTCLGDDSSVSDRCICQAGLVAFEPPSDSFQDNFAELQRLTIQWVE